VREQEMIDDDLGSSDVTVEVATKTVHVVPINKLIERRDSHSPSPRELARKNEHPWSLMVQSALAMTALPQDRQVNANI
jgi:hypothetical protein